MSNENPKLSWKQAFLNTEGPGTTAEFLSLFIKGVLMGIANIIPGVSGGTIALITGIYNELLEAIRSFSLNTVRHLLHFEIKQAIATLHMRFLVTIFVGLGVSILSIAHIMQFLFTNYEEQTWALFFGLVLASILVMGIKTKNWMGSGGINFVVGTLFAYYFVGLIPVSTPETWWFILIAGAIAICTMILPGLSGSFFLLIIGKYEYIIGALKQPFLPENLVIIAIFGMGCIVGIVSFSRVLSVLLENYENATMAFLTGIMCGSLRKIWPWKEVLEKKMIHGKLKIISEQNILPQNFDEGFYLAIVLVVVGFVLVLLMEKIASRKSD